MTKAIHYCYHQPPQPTRDKTQCGRHIALDSDFATTNQWPDVTCRKCRLNGPLDVPLDVADMTVTQAWYLALIAKHGLIHHRGFGSSYAIRLDLKRRGGLTVIHNIRVPDPIFQYLAKAGLIAEDKAQSDWRTGYYYPSPAAKALNPAKTLARLQRRQGPTPKQAEALRAMNGRKVALHYNLSAYAATSQYTSVSFKAPTVLSLLVGGWVQWDADTDEWDPLLVLTASGRKVLDRIAKAEAQAQAGK